MHVHPLRCSIHINSDLLPPVFEVVNTRQSLFTWNTESDLMYSCVPLVHQVQRRLAVPSGRRARDVHHRYVVRVVGAAGRPRFHFAEGVVEWWCWICPRCL